MSLSTLLEQTMTNSYLRYVPIHYYLPPSFLLLLSFFLITAALVACGRSWARGWIGAASATYATVTATLDLDLDPSGICDLLHSLWPHWILWVRPRIEPASSWTSCWVLNLQSHHGNSSSVFFAITLVTALTVERASQIKSAQMCLPKCKSLL